MNRSSFELLSNGTAFLIQSSQTEPVELKWALEASMLVSNVHLKGILYAFNVSTQQVNGISWSYLKSNFQLLYIRRQNWPSFSQASGKHFYERVSKQIGKHSASLPNWSPICQASSNFQFQKSWPGEKRRKILPTHLNKCRNGSWLDIWF